MSPERIGRHVSGGSEPEEERAERQRRDALREALAFWPTGVGILAVREGPSVHALTVGSFLSVSLDPPLVLASLGPSAAALPFLEPGTRFVFSILGDDQKGLAARFADSFPVGPPPFPEAGEPVVEGSVAAITCQVEEMLPRGDHTLVLGRVLGCDVGEDRSALAYFRRAYHSVGPASRRTG